MNNIISHHWTSDTEKLEAFVLNKLNKKEMSLLSAHMEKCNECSERVKEERELRAGIHRFGRLEMKRRLKSRLRRDQGRRLEWTHVASLAAAIIIVLSGVFTIRYFLDFKQEKAKVQEIIITENKESKPEERALWITGKIIEIKDESINRAVPAEKEHSLAFTDNLKEIPEQTIQNEVKAGVESRIKIQPSMIKATEDKVQNEKAEQAPAALIKQDLSDTDHYEGKKTSGLITKEISEPESLTNSYGEAQSSSQLAIRGLASRDTSVKGKLAQRSRPDLTFYSKSTSGEKDVRAQTTENKPELRQITSAAPSSAPKLEKKPELREEVIAERKLMPPQKKRLPAKNILVRRGDMKDLPASMRTSDPSAIQTKLERTAKGVLLTFYSNAIKDTAATFIEAVTKDSIVVSFKNKQIAYRIPGD